MGVKTNGGLHAHVLDRFDRVVAHSVNKAIHEAALDLRGLSEGGAYKRETDRSRQASLIEIVNRGNGVQALSLIVGRVCDRSGGDRTQGSQQAASFAFAHRYFVSSRSCGLSRPANDRYLAFCQSDQ